MKFGITKETTSCSTSNSGCCSAKSKGKETCPSCGEMAKGVLPKTVQALVTKDLEDYEGFFYCTTPSCSTVYFQEDTLLTQKDLKVIVGLKEGAKPATVCYCFEWTKEKIEAQLKETGACNALEDIQNKMETIGCSCETMNPSGGCCLGDVGKVIKELN